MRSFLTIAFLLVGTASAQAEITIMQAEYAAGVLVVRGETSQPDQRVVVDERYDTYTDRNKEFRFRIRYLPPDCTISIRAGEEERPARVANCEPVLPSPGPGWASPTSNQPSAGAQMRVVREFCSKQEECRVLCAEDEFAVNAFCAGGEAKLTNERTVTCGKQTASHIVAYCLAPGK